ncbi:Ankyrin repeat domain-containing protein 13B, partial [Operophtera brumata]
MTECQLPRQAAVMFSNKSGIWGWRQDKSEIVNGYDCKVFSANNVEIVSKTRCEHLPAGARRTPRPAPIAGLLGLPSDSKDELDLELEEDSSSGSEEALLAELPPVTWQEYFSGEAMRVDIGRSKDMTTKVQKFKATLSLCEDYPLEIPLFHVMNARITFGNIFGTETAVPLIECIQEGERLSCVIDDQCFDIGRGYKDAGSDDRLGGEDGEEGLLQYAIQQSLMEAGTHEDQ